MKRRTLLQAAFAAPVLLQVPRLASAQQLPFDPKPGSWRTFELSTRVEILKPAANTRAWIPVPSVESDFQKTLGDTWSGNPSSAAVVSEGRYGAKMLAAQWPDGESAPTIEVTSRFSTRSRAATLAAVHTAAHHASAKLDDETRRLYTAPTEFMPTDGIVLKTATGIVSGSKTDLEKARAIYEWIVDNTFRDPKTKGCGLGDVRVMLETGYMAGKCADLNALYVALARSVGLPARDVYGIRVAKSDFGYRSLGAGTDNVTRAQHCRAEVFIAGIGWLAVDPADVRKVVLEERAQPTTLADPIVPPVRQKLFGAWEGNWLAYNNAHDVTLPGASGPPVPFLMYPQAEAGGARLDCLDPDSFRYHITAREIAA
jgi:transglutaminase-like putative cysteine protease